MEETTVISLRPLLEPPVRWWRVIVVCVLIAGAVSLMRNIPVLSPDTYQAIAGVAIVKSRTQVTFDTSVKTLSEEQLQQAGQAVLESESEARRETLVGLVHNGTIAEKVFEEFYDQLPEDRRSVSELHNMVSAKLSGSGRNQSDLIQIIVESRDPVLASHIANAWAREYVQIVNDVYTRPPEASTTMLEDLETAKQAYTTAQEAMTSFQSENYIAQAERQMKQKTDILKLLQTGRQVAISTTIDLEIESKIQLYQTYINNELNNRLLAINQEQGYKRDRVNTYIDTQQNARQSVFDQQASQRQRIFNDAYANLARNDSLLRRAKALRDQAQQGGDARSTSLALAFLKAEVAGTSSPGNLDLRFETVDSLAPADLARDTQALVSALETQRQELNAIIEQQRELLLEDEGLSLDEPITDTVLTALIQTSYPDLFVPGELSALSASVGADNSLANQAQAIANDLLQMSSNRELLSFSSDDTPLNGVISDLEDDIRTLQSQLERESATLRVLKEDRDRAWNTYATLARKVEEFKVANQLPGSEVRFAAQAPVPFETISAQRKQVKLLIFLVLGMLVGLCGAFWLEYLAPVPLPQALLGSPKAPWNYLYRWMTKRQHIPSFEKRWQSKSNDTGEQEHTTPKA